ncbi:hypothetical protein RUM44_003081 [Polyplax serrata]|uniref:Uncharacterized protein n=1 Tax=Polyplax serrata TaxID=468196 RepID=A0ABR1AYZ8_POLSC
MLSDLFYFLALSVAVNGIVTNRTGSFIDLLFTQPEQPVTHFSNANKCTTRLHGSLEKLRRRQANLKSTAFIDLSGYALHQTLRHLPIDMYITDIRVRTPVAGDWVHIEKCQFSNRDNRMTTQILFNDLTVSGTVQLLDDTEHLKNSLHPIPRELCKMSLRFQRAGLGINAFPLKGRSRGLDVRTEARFLDPKFLSVHAYGCKLSDIFKRENIGDSVGSEDNDRDLSQQERYRYNGSRKVEPPLHTRIDTLARSLPEMGDDEQPEVRVITLNPELKMSEATSKWFNLHNENEGELNEFHRNRLLSTRLNTPSERDKLKAILHVQRLIAHQANQVFQAQGPFSQVQKPMFKPYNPGQEKPFKGPAVMSTITELDEHLAPIRPIQQRPFPSLFIHSDQLNQQTNRPFTSNFQNYYEVVSREMEDIFLRGIKTLLTRYVEKQLEIPLKEALMTNIGYTVSYG